MLEVSLIGAAGGRSRTEGVCSRMHPISVSMLGERYRGGEHSLFCFNMIYQAWRLTFRTGNLKPPIRLAQAAFGDLGLVNRPLRTTAVDDG